MVHRGQISSPSKRFLLGREKSGLVEKRAAVVVLGFNFESSDDRHATIPPFVQSVLRIFLGENTINYGYYRHS
jgi:hypothetical protein